MSRFTCRHCGQDTGTSDSHICGRCACLPVAERGRREPGADDDRQPTRCVHCGLVGSGATCPRCSDLLSDIGEYEDPGVAETLVEREELAVAAISHQRSAISDQEFLTAECCPLNAPDTATLRARLVEASRRREYVWLAGRADLLRRCATFGVLARAQPR